MNDYIMFLSGVLISIGFWLIFTKKIKFPILFEAGIGAIIVGLFLYANSIAEKAPPNEKGTGIIIIGAALIGYSLLRARRKRLKELRTGEPYMIDGGSFRKQ